MSDRVCTCGAVWSVAGDDELSPPTADVARCDLLCQLGALLDDSKQHTVESTQLSMIRPTPNDSVLPPRVDTAPSTGTVPPNDSRTVTSGMLYVTR